MGNSIVNSRMVEWILLEFVAQLVLQAETSLLVVRNPYPEVTISGAHPL
jgi:hypothetical protein